VEAKWSDDDVFPVIARAIETLSARQSGYVSHDTIVAQLLGDAEALSYIDAARAGDVADRTREWVVHNMVAWFSQRITVGDSPWGTRFDRQMLEDKWACRVAT
jgi:hypothetical protein